MMTIALIPLLLALAGAQEGPFGGHNDAPAASGPESPALEWPKEGDKVFVAAELTRVGGLPLFGVDVSPVPACSAFVVKRIDGKEIDIKRGDTARTRTVLRLHGDWSALMFRGEEECRIRFSSSGQPKIIRTGNDHALQ